MLLPHQNLLIIRLKEIFAPLPGCRVGKNFTLGNFLTRRKLKNTVITAKKRNILL